MRKNKNERGGVVIVLLIVVFVFIVGLALAPDVCGGTRILAKKVNTVSNLKQIGCALELYSSDQYYGEFPHFDQTQNHSMEIMHCLYQNGDGILGDEKVFLCPTLPSPPGGVLRCDFVFTPNLSKDLPASAVVACNVPEAFDDGIALLYKDTHVNFVKCDKSVFVRWAQDFENGDEKAQFGPVNVTEREGD